MSDVADCARMDAKGHERRFGRLGRMSVKAAKTGDLLERSRSATTGVARGQLSLTAESEQANRRSG